LRYVIGSRKLEKILNLLSPTDGKTTNPGLPKALAGQADLKIFYIKFYPLVVFNPLENFLI
jgi:hypothetical protein